MSCIWVSFRFLAVFPFVDFLGRCRQAWWEVNGNKLRLESAIGVHVIVIRYSAPVFHCPGISKVPGRLPAPIAVWQDRRIKLLLESHSHCSACDVKPLYIPIYSQRSVGRSCVARHGGVCGEGCGRRRWRLGRPAVAIRQRRVKGSGRRPSVEATGGEKISAFSYPDSQPPR